MTSHGSGDWSRAARAYMSAVQEEQLSKIRTWASLIDWPFSLFLELVAHAYCGAMPDARLMKAMSNLTILTPQGSNPLTVEQLTRLVIKKTDLSKIAVSDSDRAESSRKRTIVRSWFTAPYRFTDDDVLSVWPARTKMDLALRRTRFRDVWQAYQSVGLLPMLEDVLSRLERFDYIAVCNVAWAAFLLRNDSTTWWETVRAWPCWYDPAVYLTAVKAVSDKVKARSSLAFERGWFSEMGTLLGYRNPPFPGFDLVEEARSLASGGEPHGFTRTVLDPGFVSSMRSLRMAPHHGVFPSFHEYVVGGEWVTAGASTIGEVKWKTRTESGVFKARKNLVPDCVDLEQVYRDILRTNQQVNKPIIKAELGKIRLAVSSDMYTYLMMSWLSLFMTHSYKGWNGSTIEETPVQQTRRQRQMLDDCRADKWHLPFDFSGFDHQPTTDELVAIFRKMQESCRDVVPPNLVREYDSIYDRVVRGMRNSWLYVRDGDRRLKLPISGGLMSGLRWTSLVGNAWNTTMTKLVFDTFADLRINFANSRSFIRGDDSALAFGDWASTLLFRLGYQAINAVGADGKFMIHRGSTEFLRTWYSKDGLSGYAMRTIPGLVQRKPWNPAPWMEEGVMDSLYGVVQILRRRLGLATVESGWSAIKTVWSRRKHLSQSWLCIPKPRGFGIEPWDGKTWSTGPAVSVPSKVVELASNGFSAAKILADPCASRYALTAGEAEVIAQADLLGKASADDIPDVSSAFRKATVYNLKERTFADRRMFSPSASDLSVLATRCATMRVTESTAEAHDFARRVQAGDWGTYSHLSHEWEFAQKWARVSSGRNARVAFELWNPDFAVARKVWEARGMRRSDAVGWLMGDLQMPKVRRLHPMLASVLSAQIVNVLGKTVWRPSVCRNLSKWMVRVSEDLENALFSSPLSRDLYMW